MRQVLRYCNGTYLRHEAGWLYWWGEAVPNAVDLALGDLLSLDGREDVAELVERIRPLTDAERRWLAGDHRAVGEVFLRPRNGRPPNSGDLVVGLLAPELHPTMMLTVEDIARKAGITKATVDSYRYRGYLPQPQITCGRTPLWARPVIAHWLENRPGAGWRSDVYRDVRALGTAGASPRR